MVTLAEQVAHLYPAAVPLVDYRVQDDGQGAHLAFWNTTKLGALPTADQLAAADLPVAQKRKCDQIDAKTTEILARGFTFGGVLFGLTPDAHLNWVTLSAAQSQGLLTYPLPVVTAGKVTYSIPDAATLAQFCAAGMATGLAATDSGRLLNDQVMAATTVAAVDAITDTRS